MTADLRRFLRHLLLGVIVALLTLLALLVLPQDRAIRWRAVKIEAFARLGWIYQRIHDDPTPIDIAFIGTSHSMLGIDTPLIQQELDQAGLRLADGRCAQLVNFAIPSYGRDLHWLLARELLANRSVKTLVVEVFENETRKAHPLFVHVADVRDVLTAPALINLNYLHNLIRLPYRQLQLALKSRFPASFGLKSGFDPADYDGSDVDNTQVINVGGAALSPLRTQAMDPAALNAAAKAHLAAKNAHMLPAWAARYEYAVPDRYLTALLDLAEAKGTRVIFLYLPQYGMPDRPVDDHLYAGRGDWLYEGHFNASGALAVSHEVAEELTAALKQGPAFAQITQPALCPAAGYPPRAQLTPFKSGHNGGQLNEP